MDLGLKDSVAFISGSSRGIGFSIAKSFLQEDAKVMLSGRTLTDLDTAVSTLSKQFGKKNIAAFQGDLRNQEDISEAFEKTLKIFGKIDSVVANIGSGTARSGWEITREEWDAAFEQNLMGSMTLAKVALSHLTKNDSGSLTFISSIAGLEALDAPLPYGIAKAGIISAGKSLARLVAEKGIRVNTVAPGNIFFPGGTWEKKLGEKKEFFEKYIQTEVPMKRFGTPEEIANVVVFLASSRASFITGTCIVVDGGQTRAFF
ncbi:MAG: SDR family oxidoreductase [Candidatus Riflebacteria bacterium]|nr:SDR family oxidoreductase [Candidatus Riflebacteria bacterium]